jgi:hypothetical protein
MKYTKQQLIEKINKNDTKFFKSFYDQYWEKESDEPENRYKHVWELNWGDGNDLFVAINFPDEDITVYMRGWYSSYSDSRITHVALGVSFQHTETRYRPATPDEIRDMRIDEILK